MMSFSASSASFWLASGKSWYIIVGFIPAIFTFPLSWRTFILQGMQRDVSLFLLRNWFAYLPEHISIIFIGFFFNPFAASLSFRSYTLNRLHPFCSAAFITEITASSKLFSVSAMYAKLSVFILALPLSFRAVPFLRVFRCVPA